MTHFHHFSYMINDFFFTAWQYGFHMVPFLANNHECYTQFVPICHNVHDPPVG